MPSPDGAVDLRSDTVTTPDAGDARAPWPTPRSATTCTARTRRSTGSRRSRPALLGKEAALYVPSGTMANQLAIRVLASPGHRGALCRARARVPLRGCGGAASNAACRCDRSPIPAASISAG